MRKVPVMPELCHGYAVCVDMCMWTDIKLRNAGIEHTLCVYILRMKT